MHTELMSYHQLEEFGEAQKKIGDTSPYVLPTSQNPHWNPPWLSDACITRKDPEPEKLARNIPEANPIIIKPKTASHVAGQFSWVPLPWAALYSKVSCYVSICVSSIYF